MVRFGLGRRRGRGEVVVWIRASPACFARVPFAARRGGKWRALLFSGFPRPRE